jgi:hypothetical protein
MLLVPLWELYDKKKKTVNIHLINDLNSKHSEDEWTLLCDQETQFNKFVISDKQIKEIKDLLSTKGITSNTLDLDMTDFEILFSPYFITNPNAPFYTLQLQGIYQKLEEIYPKVDMPFKLYVSEHCLNVWDNGNYQEIKYEPIFQSTSFVSSSAFNDEKASKQSFAPEKANKEFVFVRYNALMNCEDVIRPRVDVIREVAKKVKEGCVLNILVDKMTKEGVDDVDYIKSLKDLRLSFGEFQVHDIELTNFDNETSLFTPMIIQVIDSFKSKEEDDIYKVTIVGACDREINITKSPELLMELPLNYKQAYFNSDEQTFETLNKQYGLLVVEENQITRAWSKSKTSFGLFSRCEELNKPITINLIRGHGNNVKEKLDQIESTWLVNFNDNVREKLNRLGIQLTVLTPLKDDGQALVDQKKQVVSLGNSPKGRTSP